MSDSKLPNLWVCIEGGDYVGRDYSVLEEPDEYFHQYIPASRIRELVEKLEQRVAGMQGGMFNAARVPYEMCIEQLNKLCEVEK